MSATASVLAPVERQEAVRSKAALPAPSRYYRPELDLLRFLAFLSVFVHHGISSLSPLLSNTGAFGLSLFFLLSAFLITELLQRERQVKGTIEIRNFYIRRSLRIWPLYYGFLLLAVMLGVFVPSHKPSSTFLFSFIFMVGNLYVGRHGFPVSPAGFLWSVSIEEQFYLFWPLLNRHCRRRTLVAIVSLAFPLGTGTVLLLCARHEPSQLGIWSNTAVQFQTFAMGALLSLLLRGKLPKLPGSTRCAMFAGGVGLWLVAAKWGGMFTGSAGPIRSGYLVSAGYLLSGLGCVAIFLSLYGMRTKIPATLLYLGQISYGLYVFHDLALQSAAWILNRVAATNSVLHHARFGIAHLGPGFALSVLLAACSYRFFERPFLKLKDAFTAVPSRTA